jgi:photosystem II stability/assembly factor-like uncharacterized protein
MIQRHEKFRLAVFPSQCAHSREEEREALMRRDKTSWIFHRWTAGLLLALALADPAGAASPWTPFGPGGGSVLSLAVDSGNSALVYAVAGVPYSSPGTVYRSADGGDTWKALVGPGFQAVATAPDHPSTVYAGGDRLLRSTDGGQTWTDLTPPPAGEHAINSLAVSPGGVIFAADGVTVLRSADGGGTWSVVAAEEFAFPPLAIQAAPADPNQVAFASSRALYVSADGGFGFRYSAPPSSDGTTQGSIGAFAFAPSAPITYYAMLAGDPRVFRSDDWAATWRVAGTLPIGFPGATEVLLVDPRNPNRVYVGTSYGLLKSEDGGKSWKRSEAGLPRPLGESLRIVSLAAAPSQPEALYAGTFDWGVARSRSAGERWQIGLEYGLNAGTVRLLKFPRPDTALLALGDQGTRSFRSKDGGRTWQQFARELSRDGLNDLAWAPTHPETLYAFNGTGLWRSLNGGDSWKRISASTGGHLAVLDGSTFVADVGCGLFRSGNGGKTWRKVLRCEVTDEDIFRIEDLQVDPRNSRTIYAYANVSNGSSHFGYAVYRSRDGGLTWKTLPVTLSSFAVAPSDFRILYAIDRLYERLLRSADGGDHWSVVNPHLPDGVGSLFAPMAVDSVDPDTVYLGAFSSVQVSHDGGATFAPVDTPYEAEKRGANRLWTDRNRPGRLYAMPATGGLFEGDLE